LAAGEGAQTIGHRLKQVTVGIGGGDGSSVVLALFAGATSLLSPRLTFLLEQTDSQIFW